MSKDYRKTFALIGIYLILSLTFFTANAYALFSYNATGLENAKGFRAEVDSTIITTISDGNVTLHWPGEEPLPFSCDNANPNHCVFERPYNTIDPSIKQIYFNLTQDAGTPQLLNGNIIIDHLSPTIDSLKISKLPNGIRINYTVTDKIAADDPRCSGIAKIVFFINNDPVEIFFNNTVCISTSSLFVPMSGYNPNIEITIDVYDKAGNPPTTNSTYTGGDFSEPVIFESFELMQGSAELLTYSRNSDTLVDVVVHIEDANLNTSKVFGDLSGLNSNPMYRTLYGHLRAQCVKAPDSDKLYDCKFSSIRVRPRSSTLNMTVEATDNDFNTVTQVLTKEIVLINSAGQALYIGPDKKHCESDTQCYISKNTNQGPELFYLEIEGSSYDKSLINFGFDTTKKFSICRPDETGTFWICNSLYDTPQQTSLKVYVAHPSTDDYGNQLTPISNTLIVDNDPPQLIGNVTKNIEDCVTSKDTLVLKAKIKEIISPKLKVYMNTTGVSSKELQEGVCTNTGEWECELSLDAFLTTYAKEAKNLVIEDLAGNKLNIPYTVEVCMEDINAVPNIITKVEQSIIPKVDKWTAGHIEVRTFVPLKITTITGNIIDLSIDSCTSPDANNFELIGETFFLTKGKNPILSTYVGHDGALFGEMTEMDVNCTLSARVRVGNKVYINPEVEQFFFKIELKDTALGTPVENVYAEISYRKKELKELDGTISDYESWDKWIGGLCSIAELLGMINGVIQAAKSAIYGILIALEAIPIVGQLITPILEGVWVEVQTFLGGLDNFVNIFVWPRGVIVPPTPGAFIKWGCLIYTCKFLDFGTLLQVGMDLTGKQIISGEIEYIKGGNDPNNIIFRSREGYEVGEGGAKGLYKSSYSLSMQQQIQINDERNLNPINTKWGDFMDNERMLNAIDAHQWILNPYKSTHYDNLCVPAIIYNSKKERQLKCKYVSCLEKAAASGIPKAFCDEDDRVNTCLYLDSAEWIVEKGNIWAAVGEGLWAALLNNILGIAFNILYLGTCFNYYLPGGFAIDLELFSGGWHSAFCGVTGAYFNIKEVVAFIDNPYTRPQDKINKIDYCIGVEY